ncbi:MAG: TldD protein [Dictyoglomus sp. NZ13-RE01]|nr:MAG: TldD protein [Dictyoglomus sp. NZ13-RE01]
MWGKERIFETLEGLMKKLPFERNELVLVINTEELTRFANNRIHQNVGEVNLNLFIRVGENKRKAVIEINRIDEDSFKNAIESLKIILKNQPENEELILPKPQDYKEVNNVTFEPSPEKRAQIVNKIIKIGEEKELNTFGAVSENIMELGVMNSNGLFGYAPIGYAHGKVMYMSDTSSGYQECSGNNMESIDFEYLSYRALEKCLLSQNPQDLEPGKYTVILEPLAVSEMMEQVSYFGFSAKAVREKRSFLALYQGQQIFSTKVNIYDDGLDPKGIIIPIDFEGVPKKRVELVRDGIPLGPVYDTYEGEKVGKESTGHALPPTNNFGPLPSNLFFVPGEVSLEEMISKLEKGILVTRFHYVNAFLDPINVLATGMTRDGTFLIENGKIKKPIKNMRFTQSFISALGNVEEISKETVIMPFFAGFSRVPGLRIKDFNFTGTTEF